MHLRINDVTVAPARVSELGDVLANKALPVINVLSGYRGLLCAADRATGNCAIVSLWESRQALDASESAITTVRSETLGAVDAKLNSITVAEVMREVRVRPTQAGAHSRVVRITAPGGRAAKVLEFYEKEAIPRHEAQPGFLNGRLIRDVDTDGRFAAVSHWVDANALTASESVSASLREQFGQAIAGATIERVSTSEIILIEPAP
jgi:heme-degrading monooxygenase HmoA